jgi:hypothetical protein
MIDVECSEITWILEILSVSSMMEKLSLDFLIHAFHFSVEVNIELIPLELSLIVTCHHDVIRHRRHNHHLSIISFFLLQARNSFDQLEFEYSHNTFTFY